MNSIPCWHGQWNVGFGGGTQAGYIPGGFNLQPKIMAGDTLEFGWGSHGDTDNRLQWNFPNVKWLNYEKEPRKYREFTELKAWRELRA